MLGEKLAGRYQIINHLGGGGFGTTFVAEDTGYEFSASPSGNASFRLKANAVAYGGNPSYSTISPRPRVSEAQLARCGEQFGELLEN